MGSMMIDFSILMNYFFSNESHFPEYAKVINVIVVKVIRQLKGWRLMHYKLTTTHLHRPHRRLLTTWSITSRLEVHHPLNNLLARWAHLVLATAVVIMPTTITIVCCPVHPRTQQRMWQPANRRPSKPKLIVGMSSRGIIIWSPSKPVTENHRVRVARVKYSSLLLMVMEELWTVLSLIMVSVT